MRHLFCDVDDTYPLGLVVRIRLQEFSRSSAEAEAGNLSVYVALHRFGGGCWRALGGTPEGHVTERAPSALDALGFHTYAGGGRR